MQPQYFSEGEGYQRGCLERLSEAVAGKEVLRCRGGRVVKHLQAREARGQRYSWLEAVD